MIGVTVQGNAIGRGIEIDIKRIAVEGITAGNEARFEVLKLNAIFLRGLQA